MWATFADGGIQVEYCLRFRFYKFVFEYVFSFLIHLNRKDELMAFWLEAKGPL